jgi:hypothetical protein
MPFQGTEIREQHVTDFMSNSPSFLFAAVVKYLAGSGPSEAQNVVHEDHKGGMHSSHCSESSFELAIAAPLCSWTRPAQNITAFEQPSPWMYTALSMQFSSFSCKASALFRCLHKQVKRVHCYCHAVKSRMACMQSHGKVILLFRASNIFKLSLRARAEIKVGL